VTNEPLPPRLPPRPPRSLAVHFGVDAAVAFLAILVLFLIFDVPLVAIAIVALVAGAIAAPFTRRAEERALAARDRSEPDT
jgi:membrane protein implicated in regulation of membrane protease activity